MGVPDGDLVGRAAATTRPAWPRNASFSLYALRPVGERRQIARERSHLAPDLSNPGEGNRFRRRGACRSRTVLKRVSISTRDESDLVANASYSCLKKHAKARRLKI
jgi:hypothetical protein